MATEKADLESASLFLERVVDSALHLCRLADVQVIRHGLPPTDCADASDASAPSAGGAPANAAPVAPPTPSAATPSALSSRDELLQTMSFNLTSFYMRPEHSREVESLARAQPTVGVGVDGSSAAAFGSSRVPSAGGASVYGGGASVPAAFSSTSAGAAGAGGGSSSLAGAHGAPSSDVGLSGAGASSSGAPPTLAATGSRWTTEELVLFEAALVLYGEKHPAQIAAHMGTRTSDAVRERIKAAKRKKAKNAAVHAQSGGGAGAGDGGT